MFPKNLPFDKVIKQQEGILAYKVNSVQYLLGVSTVIKQQEGILAYKVNSVQYLLVVATFLNDVHFDLHYQLRNDSDLAIYPLYRAIKTRNNLPNDLRSSSSIFRFKKKIKLMWELI